MDGLFPALSKIRAAMTASWREKMKMLLQEDLNDLRGGHDITQSEDSEVSREETGAGGPRSNSQQS
jgi:hypothetical protein